MEKPKLLIIAGPNGSGKTSVTSRILKHTWIEGCEYVNPDNIARDVFGELLFRTSDRRLKNNTPT
jgi:predicted ABC-type ATPase